MNKVIIAVIVGLVVVLGGVGLAFSRNNSDNEKAATNQQQEERTSNDEQDQTPKENEVFIDNFAFSPEKIVVKVGTTVTWTNNDTARHNIDYLNEDMEDSELLAQGEIYQYTFNEVGVFEYICTPHPYMTASVEVVEG